MPGHCGQARLRTRLLRELPGTAGGTTASPSPRRADGPKNNGADRADRVAGAGRALAGCSPCSRDPRGSLPTFGVPADTPRLAGDGNVQKLDRWGIGRCWFGIWGVTLWLELIVGFLAGSLQHSTSRGVRCTSTVLALRVLAGV